MGEKFNTPDPGAGQSTTTDEAAQRGFMKHHNERSEPAGEAGPPTAGVGTYEEGGDNEGRRFMKIDNIKADRFTVTNTGGTATGALGEQIGDVQGEATAMAINEKGLPRKGHTKD